MRCPNRTNRVLLGFVLAAAVSTGYSGGQLAAEGYCEVLCHQYTDYGWVYQGGLFCFTATSFRGELYFWHCQNCMDGLLEDVPLTVEKRKAIPQKIIRRSFGFRQVPFQGQDGPML